MLRAFPRIALRSIRATKAFRRISMQGKVVVVTGAFGALGKVVAQAALARGASVASVDYAGSDTAGAPDHIELGGVDLSDAAQAATAIEAVVARFGRLDILINIAGAFSFETIADGDPKTWQRLHAINVLTALNASRAAMAHLAAAPAGRIVNIGAMGALQAARGRSEERRGGEEWRSRGAPH